MEQKKKVSRIIWMVIIGLMVYIIAFALITAIVDNKRLKKKMDRLNITNSIHYQKD